MLGKRMTKKRKTVRVGITVGKPISASEHRRLEKRIRKRHEKLRKRYGEIHGKAVDWICHNVEQGCLYVSIRFKDKTDFSLRFTPQIATDYVELLDISTGDSKLIREYYERPDL